MEYSKLIYYPHLSSDGQPMLEVDAVPEIRMLHNEINMLELYGIGGVDPIVQEIEDMFAGKEDACFFSSGEFLSFDCDRDDCDVWDFEENVIAKFHTKDIYDMLKSFQTFRNNYYASRQK